MNHNLLEMASKIFHNLHTWASENPHEIRIRSSQHRFKYNVWAGIINRTLIGPIFLLQNLDSPAYLRHLRQTVFIY